MTFSIPPSEWEEAQKQPTGKVLESPLSEKQAQPTYEDRGIAYKGYAKKLVGSEQWVTIPQITQFTSVKIQNTAAFSNITARSDAAKKVFYATKLLINWKNIATFPMDCRISDVKGSAASTRFRWYPPTSDGNLVIDFSDSPRKFTGDSFDFWTQATLGAAEWIHYELFGWTEDI